MGLAISVGYLADILEHDPEGAEWFEEGMTAANKLLNAAGLPSHTEPRVLPPLVSRASLCSFPYSFIHYLRRAYAYRSEDPDWIATPVKDGIDPGSDPAIEEALESFSSHLLCHSDAEGYYLPVDFHDVLFADDEADDLPGGMLGSSYRLLEELVLVAPALGIDLQDGLLSDVEAERINQVTHSDEGLHREYASWLALYDSAQLSIQHGSAIVFS
ncbi:hypothetical protein VVD49_08490 [Uliginosibacterium sp. H3]|uniref:DUF1877 family protein n=1 Tax=Uliginosibacterium silvisoli TaxID=3114758 RepID=A0ABU6K297_9RHOO|nr:hypothetical protein [Uliginosibacterium sp. H3]